MAVVALSNSNNRREDFEGTPSFTSIGGGAGAAKELVTYLQGIASGSRKVTATTSAGFWVNIGTTVDMTTGDDKVWMIKILLYDYTDLNATGFRVRLGDTTAAYYEYLLADNASTGLGNALRYRAVGGVLGGWLCEPLNPNVTAWRDFSSGSPSLTIVDEYAVTAALATGAAKSENIFMDAIDLGDGLWLVGGDSTDTDGTFEDFRSYDEGTSTNRFCHVTSKEGIFYVYGKLVIGRTSAATVTATEFTDSNATLVFPGGRVDAGWNGVECDLGNASTVVSMTNCTLNGRGRTNRKQYFDSISSVNGTTDEITFSTAHGYFAGDAVLYSKEGGADAIGLTDATEYFIEVISSTVVNIHSTRQNALTAATPVNLTAGSTGENHSFTRRPDTRPDLTYTSTSGSATATGCTFNGLRTITLRSVVTHTGCTYLSCNSLALNGGSLDACSIQDSTTNPGSAFITAATLTNITDCAFEKTTNDGGHAIEITSAAGSPYTFSGNTFTGYGPNRASFITSAAGVDGSTEVITTDAAHGFSDGDEVYYEKHGGSASIGLTDSARYYVNSITTTTLSLHRSKNNALADTNRINLTASGTETHYLYSARAAILNSSGTAITISVGTGQQPTIRNTSGSSTTVSSSVPLEVNSVTEGTRILIIGNGGIEDGVELLAGYADSTGKLTGSFTGSTPQNVIVKARNSGLVAAAIMEDSPSVYTDYTNDARDKTGSNDVTLLPATPAINDAFYIAGLAQFGGVDINVTTAGDTYVLIWEYYNGSGWSTLSVVDSSSSFYSTGWHTITFTKPGNWATTTINTQGPFYYIRARVTSGGGTQPFAEEISLFSTIKYEPFTVNSTIAAVTGLNVTAVWVIDTKAR
jgi:hypothetical protein